MSFSLLLPFVIGGLAPPATDHAGTDFARDVRPLLSRACFACHGPDEAARQGGLRLDLEEGSRAERDGVAAVVPGEPGRSELVRRIRSADAGERMPPPESGHALAEDEVDLLVRWIEGGAGYEEHWAFVAPERPTAPALGLGDRGPIDAFVRARLDAAGLTPAPEADRFTLARRLALDLTGIPPAPEAARRFAEDPRPDAYERYVDDLLASPDYGERWARVWLDLARYADSAGYGSDPLRTIWRWRDWVIEAYDRNLPYDEFTRLQMAGDLLPDASVDARLATAFHRNSMTNTEGGTDDEEFRVEAVKDRTNTTMAVWMGLTARCAQCHSHKYDPLSQEEYYRLFAFLDQTADADRNDDAPRLRTPTRDQAARLAALEGELAAARAALAAPAPGVDARFEAWLADVVASRAAWRPLVPAAARAERAAFVVEDDGAVRVADPSEAIERAELALELEVPAGRWTALALEAAADPALPGGGPGLSPGNGNFVLTELVLERPPSGETPRARRVRVDLPGAGRILSLAEVEVFAGGANVAPRGAARQSSVAYGGPPGRAIDGVTDGRFDAASVTHTATEDDPWWELDLAETAEVDRVVLHNRTDGDLHRRLDGAVVTLLDEDGRAVWRTRLAVAAAAPLAVAPAEEPQELSFAAASASFAQEGFPADAAVDGVASGRGGWAIAPRQGSSHRAVFALADPLDLDAPARLVARLAQDFGGGHVLGSLRVFLNDHPRAPAALPAELGGLVSALTECSDVERARLAAYFDTVDPARAEQRAEVARLEEAIGGLDVVTTPVLEELPPERRRTTHVLEKGNFLQKGAIVGPGVPAALHPWPAGAPLDRRGLAEWLVDPANPLTARVAANRLWANLFGAGLVETEEDFGNQGTPPSHPELLDWLAVELVENGWDQKALLRTIVTSSTYRRAAVATPARLAADPENRLLSRGSRFRLDAETVRDQALAISGLLSRERFGPPVFPPQPEGLWRAAFNGQRNWRTSVGEDRYRRAIYTLWRRTIPYPSMEIFDAPSREVCTLRRFRTNTPLQAFVTLNDPVYVEAAQALGRAMHAAGGDDRARARAGLWRALVRPPRAGEIDEVVALVDDARRLLAEVPESEAVLLATDPLGALPEGLSPREAAAWTAAANVLLNLDAVLTRN